MLCIVTAVYKLETLDREQTQQLGHEVMNVIIEHLVLQDPHAAFDLDKREFVIEFAFDCPFRDDHETDGRKYASTVKEHACKRAGIAEEELKLVYIGGRIDD